MSVLVLAGRKQLGGGGGVWGDVNKEIEREGRMRQ